MEQRKPFHGSGRAHGQRLCLGHERNVTEGAEHRDEKTDCPDPVPGPGPGPGMSKGRRNTDSVCELHKRGGWLAYVKCALRGG